MIRNFCKACGRFISLQPARTGVSCPDCGKRTVRREGTIKIDRAGLRAAAATIRDAYPGLVQSIRERGERVARYL